MEDLLAPIDHAWTCHANLRAQEVSYYAGALKHAVLEQGGWIWDDGKIEGLEQALRDIAEVIACQKARLADKRRKAA